MLKIKLAQGTTLGILDETAGLQHVNYSNSDMRLAKIIERTVWSIWQERNKRILEQESCDKIKLKRLTWN